MEELQKHKELMTIIHRCSQGQISLIFARISLPALFSDDSVISWCSLYVFPVLQKASP